MIRLLMSTCLLLLTTFVQATIIPVKNIDELNAADKKAKPGDVIVLQNGDWNNVSLRLSCEGTEKQPITFKAQTPGKVRITGQSSLKIGGSYIIVDGLYFVNGYAGKDPVISFRIDSKKLANYCRVTNTRVEDFNNPKRMDENNWVLFYGRHNRLDHCSFRDKKNMGVLLAVILDDDRSRQNFHSIDHNYFGRRPPLASNGGEMIRVGVSQHCEFYSNTQMTDNFFEHCDGETEIISVKSCGNVVRGNLFKECQGGVVLRHGNYNTVENNIFLGNGKEGTGGVRVINKGQWVINNFFYKCRGVDFRSPLSVMNGIPNSPAHRYVQVTEAVIANNSFYDCTPASFGEGSDQERTLAPENVWLANNVFLNQQDSLIFRAFDRIDGFTFAGNRVSNAVAQSLPAGFKKETIGVQANPVAPVPAPGSGGTATVPDSLQQLAKQRLQHALASRAGFADAALLKRIVTNATTACGATWGRTPEKTITPIARVVRCATTEEIRQQLASKDPVIIELTAGSYNVDAPFVITKYVEVRGATATPVRFSTSAQPGLFVIGGKGNLYLNRLLVNGEDMKARYFICNDSSGSSEHYVLRINNCSFQFFSNTTGCTALFFAHKSMIADSIGITNSNFANNSTNGFLLNDEKDDKGYYAVEKMNISNNRFSRLSGALLSLYRGGNDESTMGPQLLFANNKIEKCLGDATTPLISFTGVQVTKVMQNDFRDCNPSGILLKYADKVRARHWLQQNLFINCGTIDKDMFVMDKNNTVQSGVAPVIEKALH